MDIAATEGEGSRACTTAVVAYADAFAGFGRLVIVDHGAQTFSLYGNLKDIEVQRGARVTRETLGTVGVSTTGAAGLYFELRIDGRPVDPLQWLKKQVGHVSQTSDGSCSGFLRPWSPSRSSAASSAKSPRAKTPIRSSAIFQDVVSLITGSYVDEVERATR
mgnify:CR=1 FL=1